MRCQTESFLSQPVDLWRYLVLRLYPSVPVNSRTALKTTTLPVGGGNDGRAPILVHKGEAVGYCVYTMHRRRDLFGEDAEVFRPERWEDDPVDGPDLKNIGWAYLPFNAGPRVCLGRTLTSFLSLCSAANFDICLSNG